MKINAVVRSVTGKKVKALRVSGKIPAVVYGHHIPTTLLEVDQKEFESIYARSGESTLVELAIDRQQPQTVLVHDIQRHFLTDAITHVDFYHVDMSERIKANVHLVFEGESKAVKDLGGVIVKNITELEVEALPADLPPSIIVDVSKLYTFEDIIHVSDLNVSADKVRILQRPEEIVAKVTPPRSEEELKALEEKPVEEVAAVEGVVKEPVPAAAGEGEETKEPKKKDN